LYCEHVGIAPGAQYKYKTKGKTLDNYFREREFVPRGSGDEKDLASAKVKHKTEIDQNEKNVKDLVTKNKWEPYKTTSLFSGSGSGSSSSGSGASLGVISGLQRLVGL
jgi:hypothetical protein